MTEKHSRAGRTTSFSSPAGTYGGWIPSDALDARHALSLIELILGRFKNLTWRLNPFDPVLATVVVSEAKPDFTQVLDLRPGIDALFQTWSKGCRSSTKKALKAGITVRIAESEDDWRGYFEVYEDSLERWGDRASSRYDWPLFDALRRLDSNSVRLWLAEVNGSIAAGALCFYASGHVVYWHGAASSRFLAVSPVNGLLHTVIGNAAEQDYSVFDFNPSGGHGGVVAFKKSFGTTMLECGVVNQRSRVARGFDIVNRAKSTLRPPRKRIR